MYFKYSFSLFREINHEQLVHSDEMVAPPGVNIYSYSVVSVKSTTTMAFSLPFLQSNEVTTANIIQ